MLVAHQNTRIALIYEQETNLQMSNGSCSPFAQLHYESANKQNCNLVNDKNKKK